MGDRHDVPPVTLNRLSIYLRALRHLQLQGERTISSLELAERYHLSASQIRKDLARFGEFGIRGVGYDVQELARRLKGLLGLDREHRLVVVGVGNLGSAFVRFLEAEQGSFKAVAAVDNDRGKVGRRVGGLTIRHSSELAEVVAESGAEIGILAVPAAAAEENYRALLRAGVGAVLNFAPVALAHPSRVPTKSVDLRIHLEELAFQLGEDRLHRPPGAARKLPDEG